MVADLLANSQRPLIMAGQGTIGLEIARQADAMEAKLDAVLGPLFADRSLV